MTRATIDYSARTETPFGAIGQAIDTPQAGFYRYRLVSKGVRGGVRIWFGPPHDPVTGEELDRSWRWQAEFDGDPIDFDRVWPACTGEPITEAEYRTYVARARWAKRHAPSSPYAQRTKRLDPLSIDSPLPF